MAPTQQTIDPQLRMAARMTSLYLRPHLTGFQIMNRITRMSKGKNIEGLDSSTVMIPRSEDAGEIRARVYKPTQINKPLPLVMHLHGGGFALGIPEQNTDIFKSLIATRECIVVSPDFRNSLEAPYPAGLHDCYDTLLWIKNHAEELGGRNDQIIVMGESGGGGLTAAISLLARDKGEVNIAFQMPIYPMIDDRQNLPSARNASFAVWTTKHNKLGWDLYLRGLKEKGDEKGVEIPAYAAPARASDYSNLPPTATFVGDLELFRDETVAYVENLKKAGVPVMFEVYPSAVHGFDVLAPQADVSKQATKFKLEAFAYGIDNYTAAQTT